MVKILIVIPHLYMKKRFEKVGGNILPPNKDIVVEYTHISGTPNEILSNLDAEIMVARGMTYERLKILFPSKHLVEIKLTGFDILNALIRCKNELKPSKIALCLHEKEFSGLGNLELLCGAQIDFYNVCDDESAKYVIEKISLNKVDAVVGAGTICSRCDEYGIQRIHIETEDSSITYAFKQALNAANTINIERAKSGIMRTILNNSEDAFIAVDENGQVLAINNQAYKTYQLSAQESYVGAPIDKIRKSLKWQQERIKGNEDSEVLNFFGKNYYIQYKIIVEDFQTVGTIIITKNVDIISETDLQIKRRLSEKGLASKYTFDNIIGKSESIKDSISMAKRYSKVDSNVLIIGETGTGKEIFAHSIHSASNRRTQSFVALNCAALPENLLESELFGYEAGAFSGASKNGKIGLFELAEKGTIFLDEVGELPISLQAKLLRVLQEKEIRRIGSDRILPLDVRVISATNINMEQQIAEGNFRSDLYYRLNLLDIQILSLKERKEDIIPLVNYFISDCACEIGIASPKLTQEAALILENYQWPGNVRQLRNVCERLVVLNDGGIIDEDDINRIKIFNETQEFLKKDVGETTMEELINKITPHILEQLVSKHEFAFNDFYKDIRAKKSKKELAQELGVSRTTLWRAMKKQESEESIS